MAIKIIMPQLTTTMTEGTIDGWLKKDGDSVRSGEPVLCVETDKAIVEIEAQADGILRIVYAEGSTLAVGTAIGWILAPGEALPVSVIPAALPSTERPEVRASPAARRLARDKGIDLSIVSGSGPNGRIVSEDIVAHEADQMRRPLLGEPESEQVPLSKIRRTIAERMSQSFRSAPHFSISIEVDMSQADRIRAKWNECSKSDLKPRLSYTAVLVSTVSRLLREHRSLNASFMGDSIRRYRDINIGVAVATEEGLMVPVIRRADSKSLEEIARRLEDLQRKAEGGRFLPDEIAGGTFTISNLGMYGPAQFTAIINPPQVAILAVGSIVETPVARQGAIVIRPIMNLTLSMDHRALDGVAGAEFLRNLKVRLESLRETSLD